MANAHPNAGIGKKKIAAGTGEFVMGKKSSSSYGLMVICVFIH